MLWASATNAYTMQAQTWLCEGMLRMSRTSGRSRIRYLILAALMCLFVYAVRSQPVRHHQGSEYDRALADYRSNIEAAAEQHHNLMMRGPREAQRYQERAAEELSRNKDQILAELKATRRKLDFEEKRGPEVRAFAPASALSAEIFASLCRQGRVDRPALLARLASSHVRLAREWRPLLKEIASAYPGNSLEALQVRISLYRIWPEGFQQYRPQFEHTVTLCGAAPAKFKGREWLLFQSRQFWARDAIDALLFSYDLSTGEVVPVRSKANGALVSSVATTSGSFEVRISCAKYAALTGDVKKAERISIDILKTRYKSLAHPDDQSFVSVDCSLARAKQEAMFLLFYEVRTEPGFRTLYCLRSRFKAGQKFQVGSGYKHSDTDWYSFQACTVGRMDIDMVDSLLSEVTQLDDQ